MKIRKTSFWTAGGLAALILAGIFTAPKVSAAIKAAFVEVVIPSRPFFGRMSVNLDAAASTGPDTGTLGVTNITVTNFGSTVQIVDIFAPQIPSGGCGGTPQGGVDPFIVIQMQPASTQTFTYPTPLVFPGVQGHTCVGAATSSPIFVDVAVTGFVN